MVSIMGRPIKKEKEYTTDTERVATFRITHGKLTAFQEICAAKGISVSEALIGFIDSVIGGGTIPEKEGVQNFLDVDQKIENAIAFLRDEFQIELEVVKGELVEVKKALSDLTQKASSSVRSKTSARTYSGGGEGK